MIKLFYVAIFSILVAVVCGVAFRQTYPLTEVTPGLIMLFGVVGFAICLMAAGAWSFFRPSGGVAQPKANEEQD
jgi:hypothetical protein